MPSLINASLEKLINLTPDSNSFKDLRNYLSEIKTLIHELNFEVEFLKENFGEDGEGVWRV